MKTMRAFALVAFSIFLVSSWSGPARASLFWEFGFDERVDNFEGTGTFQLDGPIGPPGTPVGPVAFEFTGVCGLDASGADNSCSFSLADVRFFVWVLEDDWTFSTLSTSSVDFTSQEEFNLVGFSPFTLRLDCFSFVEPLDGCNGGTDAVRLALFGQGAFLRPIHDAPEPPTLGLFSLALLALAAAGWLPRRRRNSGGSLSGV